MPVASAVTLKGEWYDGDNMDAFLGGIGQGVKSSNFHGIHSQGGWAAVEVEAGKGWSLTGGGGIDDPRKADLPSSGRDLNECLFANAIYAVTKNAKVGLELARWRTEYATGTVADDTRAQFSVIYEF
jgi:hypothetical protein